MSDNLNRFREYYGMSEIVANLNQYSTNNHNNLFRLVMKKNNIDLAIKKVSLGPGRNTPGPNQHTFEYIKHLEYSYLISLIRDRLYGKIKPKGRIAYIPKENGKIRKLIIINIEDRIAQQCVQNILEPITEGIFLDCSYAYRPNRNTKNAVSRICCGITTSCSVHKKYQNIVKMDIHQCFDNIKLSLCIKSLKEEFHIQDWKFLNCIRILMSIDSKDNKYEGIGLAQGTILGPILCNCLLHKLDKYIYSISKGCKKWSHMHTYWKKYLEENGMKKYREYYGEVYLINYVRYADDIIISMVQEIFIDEVIEKVKLKLNELGLSLSNEKLVKIKIGEGENTPLEFLGFKIKYKNGCIRISPTNLDIIWKRIKKSLRTNFTNIYLKKNSNKYKSLNLISSYIYYYDICTNINRFLLKINLFIFKLGYLKLRILERQNNKNVYTFSKNTVRSITINIFDIRKNTKNSYKNYTKIEEYKIPKSTLEYKWINSLPDLRYSYQNIYLHGLISKYKFDPITGKPLKELNKIDLHHIIPLNKGGTDEFTNLLPLSKLSHKLIHAKSITREDLKNSNVNLQKLNKFRAKASRNKI